MRLPDERRSQGHGAGRVAGGRGVLREVAGEHRRRRHEGEQVGRRLAQSRALVARRRRTAVGHDGTAERAADWLRFRPSSLRLPVAGSIACERDWCALNRWWRKNSKRSPWNRFVPDLVTALTDAPECMPFLAVVALVSTRNSCSASGKRQRQVQVVVRVVVRGAVEQIRHAEGLPPATEYACAALHAAARGVERRLRHRRAGSAIRSAGLRPLSGSSRMRLFSIT